MQDPSESGIDAMIDEGCPAKEEAGLSWREEEKPSWREKNRVLAAVYADENQAEAVVKRMQAWGKQGAFWGGLWGMLASAAGLFMIPGVGMIAAAGYIVEAMAGGAESGIGKWKPVLSSGKPLELHELPYSRITDRQVR